MEEEEGWLISQSWEEETGPLEWRVLRTKVGSKWRVDVYGASQGRLSLFLSMEHWERLALISASGRILILITKR